MKCFRQREKARVNRSLQMLDVMEDRKSSSRDGVLWSSASDLTVDVAAMLESVHWQGGE